jgi:ATP-dependent Clp protease adapter protein ClpS
VPQGFESGIEILKDNNTTMAFVVSSLTTHLNFTREEAVAVMLTIHTKGGILISLPSYEMANNVANAITADAMANGFKLICRSVRVQPTAVADC